MGCCQSAPRHEQQSDHNGARPVAHNSSQAAINQPARSLSERSNRAPSPSPHHSNDRVEQPLRSPSPVPRSPTTFLQYPAPWTRKRLEAQREEFFDTRVTGDAQAWAAIRRVCELLREDHVEDAQAVLSASDLTCLRGRVVRSRGSTGRHGGVFDRTGKLYEIPAWVARDPEDIIESDDAEKDGADAVGGAGEDSDEEELKVASAPASPTQEKGKGRARSLGREVKVKCRLSDRGEDVMVRFQEKEVAGVIVQRVKERVGERRVQLMYCGKPIAANIPLLESGWKEGQVLNAFVSG